LPEKIAHSGRHTPDEHAAVRFDQPAGEFTSQ